MSSSCKTLGENLQIHVCNFRESLGLEIKAGEPQDKSWGTT